jgi:autotransporter-associated beta strand protein
MCFHRISAIARRALVTAALMISSLWPTLGAQWTAVPDADFSKLQLSQFDDRELEVPYFLYHFARVANAVVETGANRGFLDLKVNRQIEDNQVYNARIMEMQLPLAYFYTANRPWNVYYGHAAVRVRLEAMLLRWCQIQNQPGTTDGDFDGLYAEYSASNWSLAPTGFGVMHAAQALDLLVDSGLAFDATVLENSRVALRRAIMAIFTRADMRAAARQYSNQFNGAFHAALIYLENWPDSQLDAAFVQAVRDAAAQDQSPAGFYYEKSGPDIGYSSVHETNLRIMLPRLRQREDLLSTMISSDRRWNAWLAASLLPQPASSLPLYLTNSGINTRTTHAYQFAEDGPLREWLGSARPFARSSNEYAAYLSTRRAQVQAQFGKWGALVVPRSSSYQPAFVFAAVENLDSWHPTAAQRAGEFNQLPSLASDRFNRIFHDGPTLTMMTARRPSYYGIFNSGAVRTSGQNFGLGLLWNERFGTALQAVSLSNWTCGTRRSGGDGSLYENANLAVTRNVSDTPLNPVNGITTLENGRVTQTYPLSTFGSKTVSFDESHVEVMIAHSGGFNELLPLVHPANASIVQQVDRVVVNHPNGASFTILLTAGSPTITIGAASSLSSGLVRRLVTLEGKDSLHYQLRFATGLPLLKPGVMTDLSILSNDTAEPTPLALRSVSFAPPEAVGPQIHGRVAIDAQTSDAFPLTDAVATSAVAREILAALPGFSVQSHWVDSQVPTNSFQGKGAANGVTNYQIRTDSAMSAIRYQVNSNTTGNPSAGGFTSSPSLLGSEGNAMYVGSYGTSFGNVAITFGCYREVSQDASTLGFSTTDQNGRPLAVRAVGFVLAGVNHGRSFSVEFFGVRGQRLAYQVASGNRPSSSAKLYFGYDAGPNPADWISALVIDGDNTGSNANLGLDDLGCTPISAVDAGRGEIVGNQFRFTPSSTYRGPLRYVYTYSDADGTDSSIAQGSGEVLLDVTSPVWVDRTISGGRNWSDGSNWFGGVGPWLDGVNQPAFFTGATVPSGDLMTVQDFPSALPVHALSLDGTAPQVGDAVIKLTGNGLSFQSMDGSNPQLRLLANPSGAGDLRYVISCPLSSSSDLMVVGDGAANFELMSPLSGEVSLLKSGSSRLSLGTANRYSGRTVIGGGALRITHPAALGIATGSVFLPGASAVAALELGGGIVLERPLELAMHNTPGHAQLRNVSGDNTLAGGVKLNGGGARWEISSLAGSLTVAGNSGNIATSTDSWRTLYLTGPGHGTFTGALTDSSSGNSRLSLNVVSGEWALAGVEKSYTGSTVVQGGILRVDTSMLSPIIVQKGGAISGSGSCSSSLTIHDGGRLIRRVVDWNALADHLELAQLIRPAGAKWRIHLEASEITNFSEAPRIIPVVSTTAVALSVEPRDIEFSQSGFPGTGTWSVVTAGNTLSILYTPTPYMAWVAAYSGLNGGSSPNADPDQDGFVNLLEYALGSDPVSGGSRPDVRAEVVDGSLGISFMRNSNSTDRSIVVQAADSPVGPWVDLAASVSGAECDALIDGVFVAESGSGVTRLVEVRDLAPIDGLLRPRRFFRLCVR